MARTVRSSVEAIGVALEALAQCDGVDNEWKLLRRTFMARALVLHPDKGGDAEGFAELRSSFEMLRNMYESATVVRFSECLERTGQAQQSVSDEGPPPPWSFYEAAADEDIPTYAVETAKSGKAVCQVCRGAISQDSVRAGWLDPQTGKYQRWVHLSCWRVPSKVSLGLPDLGNDDVSSFVEALKKMSSVLLSGFANLDDASARAVAKHVMNKEHWAKARKKGAKNSDAPSQAHDTPSSTHALGLPSKRVFSAPAPGVEGALQNSMEGVTCVLTGTFPEIGGGAGLDLGKARVMAMITSFGGRVTGSVSARTNLLIVGKEPGFSKFDKATRLGVKKVSLHDLAETLRKGEPIESVPEFVSELRTRDFSIGFANNGLAGKLLGPSETYKTLERAQTDPIPRSRTGAVRVKAKSRNSNKQKRKKNAKRQIDDDDDDDFDPAIKRPSRRLKKSMKPPTTSSPPTRSPSESPTAE